MGIFDVVHGGKLAIVPYRCLSYIFLVVYSIGGPVLVLGSFQLPMRYSDSLTINDDDLGIR